MVPLAIASCTCSMGAVTSDTCTICCPCEAPAAAINWARSENTYIPYFFSYKAEFFPSKNNPKNLDPSYKMALVRKGKTRITAKFHRTDLVIFSHSREGKILSYSRINAVKIYLSSS